MEITTELAPISRRKSGGYARSLVARAKLERGDTVRSYNAGNPNKTQGRQEVISRVNRTGISEPPTWRKGPAAPLRIGSFAYVLHFDAWPTALISKGLVKTVDILDRIYVIEINGRSWTVAQERIFSNEVDAELERCVHAAFIQTCYDRKEYDMLPAPLAGN